jgi:hypothetical protein
MTDQEIVDQVTEYVKNYKAKHFPDGIPDPQWDEAITGMLVEAFQDGAAWAFMQVHPEEPDIKIIHATA